MSQATELNDGLLEIEQAVVGVVTATSWGPHLLTKLLEPELFGDQRHRVLWTCMREMLATGKNLNRDAVMGELRAGGLLEVAGGADYVRRLPALYSYDEAQTFAEQVLAQGVLRLVQQAGQRLAALRKATSARDVLDQAFTTLAAVQQQAIVHPQVEYVDAVQAALDRMAYASTQDAGLVGYSTGMKSLDDLLHGLQGGKFIIVGARPGIGKSVVAAQWAHGIADTLKASKEPADARKKVLIVSLEMKAAEFTARDIARYTQINSEDLAHGWLPKGYTREQFNHTVMTAMGPTRIVFEDKLRRLSDIVSRARRMAAQGELAGIFIDYLQLVRVSGSKSSKSQNREQDVSDISRTCKELAQELDIPVVALSQLSRDVEKRTMNNKRPMVSDLRESGSLEQDADQIVMLYRPEYYKDKDPLGNLIKGTFEFDVLKNRGGSLDVVKAHCDMTCLLIWDQFANNDHRPNPRIEVRPRQTNMFDTPQRPGEPLAPVEEAYVEPGRRISQASLRERDPKHPN